MRLKLDSPSDITACPQYCPCLPWSGSNTDSLWYMPAGDIKPGEQSPAGIYQRQIIRLCGKYAGTALRTGRYISAFQGQAISEGILQSPLGESDTDPTLGPSGMQERLNCWEKKRFMKFPSHFLSVASS